MNGHDVKDDFEILNQEWYYSHLIRLYVPVVVRDNVNHNGDCP